MTSTGSYRPGVPSAERGCDPLKSTDPKLVQPLRGQGREAMYTIETGDFTMHLEVVRVDALREHEETLPHVADTLALEFRNWARLQNPIIIEKNHIVLDGNHRTFVFKRLGFRFIPVCRIDYYSEHVGLGYWFRLIKGTGGAERVRRDRLGNGRNARTGLPP